MRDVADADRAACRSFLQAIDVRLRQNNDHPCVPQHTVIHAWFMVRLLALPAAFGMTALAVAWFGSNSSNPEVITSLSRQPIRAKVRLGNL